MVSAIATGVSPAIYTSATSNTNGDITADGYDLNALDDDPTNDDSSYIIIKVTSVNGVIKVATTNSSNPSNTTVTTLPAT